MTRTPLIVAFSFLLAATACGDGASSADPDAGSNIVPDSGSTGSPDAGPPPIEMVSVSMTASVILPTNAGAQLDDLFKAGFTSGSELARMRLFVRYCQDAACAKPLALVEVTSDAADSEGYVLLTTASPSGGGFATNISIPTAPLGASYMQLIGDTKRSVAWGKGSCTELSNCPGDSDLLMTATAIISTDADLGAQRNPAPATHSIEITAAGQVLNLPDRFFLGHLYFSGNQIHTAAPADDGRLVAAISNQAHTYRNRIALIDLSDLSAVPGATHGDSYDLKKNGASFAGDICGMVAGGGRLFAIGVDNDGASIFSLDGATGQQLSETPVASFPNAGGVPWPCRGVWAEKNGHEHLYLISYEGAGALNRSTPHALHYVNLSTGATATPLAAYTDMALRGVAIDSLASKLFVVDMSWSKDAENNSVDFNRIFSFTIEADGTVGALADSVTTSTASNEQCGSTNHWPTALHIADVGGTETLLLGHEGGIASYDLSLALTSSLDLRGLGRMISQIEPGPDGRLYAVPQCKSANSDFTLPYAAGTESADKNLVAVLDPTGSSLAVANTAIDINGDGTLDHGIDFDYYHLKRYIRGFDTTGSIPPVVYVGPQVAVGSSMLFVRGTGSGGGLGQVQDVGVFDLTNGHGIVFDQYMPFLDGLSAEAGTGTGIWGYDVWPAQGSSVGWVHYIPAP